MKRINLKGVIFDFNGVIVDDYPIQKEAWNIMANKLRGKEVTDKEMVYHIRGVRTRDTVVRMSPKKLSADEIVKLSDEKDSITRNLFKTSPLFKLNNGLEEYLNDLKEMNIPRTIATSQTYDNLLLSFEKLSLVKWFELEKILYNDNTYPGKPSPDAYLLATKRIEIYPSECLVFEDAVNGIRSAYTAGVKTIVAVGNTERLKVLLEQDGVVKGIRDFSEIKFNDFFTYSK